MQRYIDPNDVPIPEGTWCSRRHIRVLQEEGQITPIMVDANNVPIDAWEASRVLAARKNDWSTILVEDEEIVSG